MKCLFCDFYIFESDIRIVEWKPVYDGIRLLSMSQVHLGRCCTCGKLTAREKRIVFDDSGSGAEVSP